MFYLLYLKKKVDGSILLFPAKSSRHGTSIYCSVFTNKSVVFCSIGEAGFEDKRHRMASAEAMFIQASMSCQ